MTDPNVMSEMLKGNITNVLPMIIIGGWINWMFSGFITSKILTIQYSVLILYAKYFSKSTFPINFKV